MPTDVVLLLVGAVALIVLAVMAARRRLPWLGSAFAVLGLVVLVYAVFYVTVSRPGIVITSPDDAPAREVPAPS